MNMGTAMNVFSLLSSFWTNSIAKFSFVVFCVLVLILSACRESERSYSYDITEDLHHRLISGIFEPGKDPFILHLRSGRDRKRTRPLAGVFMRFSSVNGSFWVKTDEQALIVLYMDKEATFSHIHFFVDSRHHTITLYPEFPTRPVRLQIAFPRY